jgi:hypothetical protein
MKWSRKDAAESKTQNKEEDEVQGEDQGRDEAGSAAFDEGHDESDHSAGSSGHASGTREGEGTQGHDHDAVEGLPEASPHQETGACRSL